MINLISKFKVPKINIQILVYLVLLSLPLYLFRFNILGIPTTILEMEIYVLVVFFLIYSIRKKNHRGHFYDFIKNPFFIPWLLFFVAGVISVFVSPDKKVALGIFKAYFFDVSLFFFIFISVVKEKSEIQKSFWALTLSLLTLCAWGLFKYKYLQSIFEFYHEPRLTSIFDSANYLSLFITPISFLLIYLFYESKMIFGKIFLFIAYLVFLITIYLTFSRGSWLGLLLGLIFLVGAFLWQKIKSRLAKILFVTLFLTSLIVSFFLVVYGPYRFGLVSQNRVYQSDNVRREIWSTSLNIGAENPFWGIGLGNFQNYFGEYTKERINYPEYITPNAVTPHNVFLNIWLQMGVLGLLALLFILSVFFIKCFRGMRENYFLNAILISAVIAILGQGLVDSAIWKNDLIIIFWFLIGVSYIINKKGEKDAR